MEAIRRFASTLRKNLNFSRELDQYFAFSYTVSRLRREQRDINVFLEQNPCSEALRISLVIPLWGIASVYVKELFESIERQTYADWEVCICVDGEEQPRGLRKLLNRYQKRWGDRFKMVWHEQNKGISVATRSAIGLVTGDVVAFVDGDDLLHREALACFAGCFAKSPDIDFVYSDLDHISDWGLRHDPTRKPAWSPHLLKTAMYINHLKAVRTSLLERCAGIFDSRYDGSQDWHFSLKATAEARRVCHIPLILYHWRKRPGSIAAHPQFKPWAYAAAYALLRDHFAGIDPEFSAVTYPILRVPSSPICKTRRPLALIRVAERRGSGFRHIPEPQQFSHIVYVSENIAAWDEQLRDLPENCLLLFQCEDAEAIYGDLAAMETFAIMSDVGATWPIFAPGIRYGYTIAGPYSGWTALGRDRTKFANHSSNMLTGPLHGMMMELRKLRAIGGFNRSEAPSTHELGVNIGLTCLRQGWRNVSVTSAFCRAFLPALPTAHEVDFDPYWVS